MQRADSGVYVCQGRSEDDVVEQKVTITVGGTIFHRIRIYMVN